MNFRDYSRAMTVAVATMVGGAGAEAAERASGAEVFTTVLSDTNVSACLNAAAKRQNRDVTVGDVACNVRVDRFKNGFGKIVAFLGTSGKATTSSPVRMKMYVDFQDTESGVVDVSLSGSVEYHRTQGAQTDYQWTDIAGHAEASGRAVGAISYEAQKLIVSCPGDWGQAVKNCFGPNDTSVEENARARPIGQALDAAARAEYADVMRGVQRVGNLVVNRFGMLVLQ